MHLTAEQTMQMEIRQTAQIPPGTVRMETTPMEISLMETIPPKTSPMVTVLSKTKPQQGNVLQKMEMVSAISIF